MKIVPGRVSTEVDAAFSFDVKASVDKALHIIDVSRRIEKDTNVLILTLRSYTARRVLTSPASSSNWHPHGRASKPPKSSRVNTV